MSKKIRIKINWQTGLVFLLALVLGLAAYFFTSPISNVVGTFLVALGGLLPLRGRIQEDNDLKPDKGATDWSLSLIGVGGAVLFGASIDSFVASL